jgi:hypothetical protein
MIRKYTKPANVSVTGGVLHNTDEDKQRTVRNQQLIDKQFKLSSGATYTVCKPANGLEQEEDLWA